MHTQIDLYSFRDAFARAGRADQFSYDALEVLFDYLTDYEDQAGESIELDVIALCCEYKESTADEIIEYYDLDDTDLDDDDKYELAFNYINENTAFCGVTKSQTIVYLQF